MELGEASWEPKWQEIAESNIQKHVRCEFLPETKAVWQPPANWELASLEEEKESEPKGKKWLRGI